MVSLLGASRGLDLRALFLRVRPLSPLHPNSDMQTPLPSLFLLASGGTLALEAPRPEGPPFYRTSVLIRRIPTGRILS